MNRIFMAGLLTSAVLTASGCMNRSSSSAGAALGSGAAMREYVIVGSGGTADMNVGQVTTYRLNRATGDLTQVDRKQVGGQASYIAANPRRPVIYATNE